MIAEVLNDVKLNLSEESLRRLETSFSLNDLRRGIYEVISLYVLRSNLYLQVFKRHQTLEKNLDKHLYVKDNKLSFRIDRLVEECVDKKKETEKKELSEKLYLLARTATAEFLKHVLKQTVAYKNAYAEAEGLLARYTIVGTDIVRFFLKGQEYQVELVPYRSGAAGSFFWQNRYELNKLKLKVLHKRKNLLAQLVSTADKGLVNFFKQKELRALDALLAVIKNRIAQLVDTADEQLVAKPEEELLKEKVAAYQQESVEQLGISVKDLETIAKLALDLNELDPVLKLLEANTTIADVIKKNIIKLEDKNTALCEEGKLFFNQLKEEYDAGQSELLIVDEDHLLAEDKEDALNFRPQDKDKAGFKKTELYNPDVQIYSHRKAKDSAKKNFFSDWALIWRKNKGGPKINTQIGGSGVLDTYSVLKGTQLKENNKKKVKHINIMG